MFFTMLSLLILFILTFREFSCPKLADLVRENLWYRWHSLHTNVQITNEEFGTIAKILLTLSLSISEKYSSSNFLGRSKNIELSVISAPCKPSKCSDTVSRTVSSVSCKINSYSTVKWSYVYLIVELIYIKFIQKWLKYNLHMIYIPVLI